MTRELMGEEKDGKCDAVPHRFAANQTGRCPRLQGRGLYLSVDRPSKLWTILSIWWLCVVCGIPIYIKVTRVGITTEA